LLREGINDLVQRTKFMNRGKEIPSSNEETFWVEEGFQALVATQMVAELGLAVAEAEEATGR